MNFITNHLSPVLPGLVLGRLFASRTGLRVREDFSRAQVSGSLAVAGGLPSRTVTDPGVPPVAIAPRRRVSFWFLARRNAGLRWCSPGSTSPRVAPSTPRGFGFGSHELLLASGSLPARFFCAHDGRCLPRRSWGERLRDLVLASGGNRRGRRLAWWLALNGGVR